MATSFAMALDVAVDYLMTVIGHDGSAIQFVGLPEPGCRRGHHIQECIEVCLRRGFSVTPVELFPAIRPTPQPLPPPGTSGSLTIHCDHPVMFGDTWNGNWSRFVHHLETSRGVITGQGRATGHAVAYDHGRIYDPDGREYDYSREACEARGFFTQYLWRLDRCA